MDGFIQVLILNFRKIQKGNAIIAQILSRNTVFEADGGVLYINMIENTLVAYFVLGNEADEASDEGIADACRRFGGHGRSSRFRVLISRLGRFSSRENRRESGGKWRKRAKENGCWIFGSRKTRVCAFVGQ